MAIIWIEDATELQADLIKRAASSKSRDHDSANADGGPKPDKEERGLRLVPLKENAGKAKAAGAKWR
jgi:hypothetical protein